MNSYQRDLLKPLPWIRVIISFVIWIAIFVMAIGLMMRGGWWIMLGVVIGLPSAFTVLGWLHRLNQLHLALLKMNEFKD